MAEERKLKIPARRVAADDCVVYDGRKIEDGKIVDPGTAHHVHAGEWIDVIPVGSLRQYFAIARLSKSGGEPEKVERALDDMCHEVAERVVAWNWTDITGEPLPQPYRNEAVIKSLTEDELMWLITAIQGETPGQRKNASAALPTNS